ncbi:hypothetical protein BKA70DRAFT_823585 [Coprinopsis sp. MPI-PUGE-AT-0042]|nr:hypothetical protein BKA70DRAFT_823585 [Coprinopsis sp. MPI-PUGE-AT-0042]
MNTKAQEFFHSHEVRTCNTVVVAYDLSRPRLRHCDPLNFRLVKDLCGPRFFANNLAIITTNWHSAAAEVAHLESRESDLRSKENCFKDFLDRGAQCHRHGHNESPPISELLRTFAAHSSMPLAIRDEVGTNLTFSRTMMGGVMARRLRDHLKMVSERSDSLKAALEEAKKRWGLFDEDEKFAMERDQEALEQTWVRLSKILEDYSS